MKTGSTILRRGLESLPFLVVASLLSPVHSQSGVTFVSPTQGQVFYAGYEGDTLASWDTMIVEWTYDDTSGPKLSSNTTVLEISPDNGMNWVTFRSGDGTKVKITSSKYLCRIDTFGYDIQSASDPGRSTISDSCKVRVYDYVNHSFGGVSGVIRVRLGPPPSGVIRGRQVAGNAARPVIEAASRDRRAMTLSILGEGRTDGVISTIDGRALTAWHGREPGSYHVRAPVGVLLVRVTGKEGLSSMRSTLVD